MASGWHNESRRHALASKGIKTTMSKQEAILKAPIQNNNRETRINKLIYLMNQSAFNDNGIKDEKFAAKLMNERMEDNMLQDRVFNNLSKDKASGQLFEEQISDPTLPIIHVDTNFLITRRGNTLNALGKSVEQIKKVVKEKNKLSSVPIYDLKSGKVEEGNHRVQALKELGYNSVPVRITGGWD